MDYDSGSGSLLPVVQSTQDCSIVNLGELAGPFLVLYITLFSQCIKMQNLCIF